MSQKGDSICLSSLACVVTIRCRHHGLFASEVLAEDFEHVGMHPRMGEGKTRNWGKPGF